MTTPTGWQCPLCGKVHAPWVPSCVCTGPPARLLPRIANPDYVEPSRTVDDFPRELDGRPKVTCEVDVAYDVATEVIGW